ncbi:MAG TPA: cyclic nucleotide-binding domain-containing protein [Bellilinea sp.]|nr:cyclic nucleotide-binding domain-containing protein [Bellilinea sp.]
MASTVLTETLSTIPWFVEFNRAQIASLAAISEIQTFESGEVLYHEGDKPVNLIIILEGQVSVEIDVLQCGRVKMYVAEPLDILGWSKLTPVIRQRYATAIAKTKTVALTIDGDQLLDLCESDNQIGYVIMRRIANVSALNVLTTKLQLMELLVHNKASYYDTTC